jgi:hypothetical protein
MTTFRLSGKILCGAYQGVEFSVDGESAGEVKRGIDAVYATLGCNGSSPAMQQAPVASPKPAPTAPAQPPARIQPPAPVVKSPPADGGICAACGAAITKQQADISNLFMYKTLCKNCMEAYRPEACAK